MEITAEQLEAIERGEPVTVFVEGVETKCVLLPQAVYENMKRVLEAEEVDPSFFECDEVDRSL